MLISKFLMGICACLLFVCHENEAYDTEWIRPIYLKPLSDI